jgi:competence protein ComEA
MSSAPFPLGVAAQPASPAPPRTWPTLAPPPAPAPALLAPADGAWPRAAQGATAVLLLGALALLGWHLYLRQAWAAQPTEIEPVLRVDLNRADRAELLQLPGVGEKLAERIETYRRDHGPFRTVDELRRVHGIGPKMLERLRPLVCVEPPDDDDKEAEEKPVPAMDARAKPDRPAAGKKAVDPSKPIDVNRASAAELQRLPGIGPKLAERILAAREKAPFKSVNDLRKVSGIGPKTLEKLRPFVTLGNPAP